jgi:hypothetical protein
MLSLDIVIYSMITWYICKARFDGRNQEAPAEAKWMSITHFWRSYCEGLCRQSIFINTRVINTNVPLEIRRPSKFNEMNWFHSSLSSLDPPSSARRSGADQSQLVSRAIARASSRASQRLERHCNSGWVLIFFLDGPWANLAYILRTHT